MRSSLACVRSARGLGGRVGSSIEASSASTSTRNRSTASLNAFGASDHQTVRRAAEHLEPRVRDQLGELLGVTDRSERVLGPGDDERRDADRRELEAQLVGRVEDRTDLGDERLGRLLQHDAGEQVEPDPEPLPQPGPDEPLERLVAQRRHPALVDRVGPLLQQLTAPVVVAARGAGEDERAGALRDAARR